MNFLFWLLGIIQISVHHAIKHVFRSRQGCFALIEFLKIYKSQYIDVMFKYCITLHVKVLNILKKFIFRLFIFTVFKKCVFHTLKIWSNLFEGHSGRQWVLKWRDRFFNLRIILLQEAGPRNLPWFRFAFAIIFHDDILIFSS